MCHGRGLRELLCGAHGELAAAVATESIHLTGLGEEAILRVTVAPAEVLGAAPTDLRQLGGREGGRERGREGGREEGERVLINRIKSRLAIAIAERV